MQESQGYTRSTSNCRLIYDFEEENQESSSGSEALSNVDEDDDEVCSYECGLNLAAILTLSVNFILHFILFLSI